jgi:hypothetical protein
MSTYGKPLPRKIAYTATACAPLYQDNGEIARRESSRQAWSAHSIKARTERLRDALTAPKPQQPKPGRVFYGTERQALRFIDQQLDPTVYAQWRHRAGWMVSIEVDETRSREVGLLEVIQAEMDKGIDLEAEFNAAVAALDTAPRQAAPRSTAPCAAALDDSLDEFEAALNELNAV